MPLITVSRQMCSFGDDIAKTLARKLDWELITRNDLFTRFPGIASDPRDLKMLAESAKYYLKPCPSGGTFIDRLKDEIKEYLETHSAVLVGFGSQSIFRERKDAVHVRIIADRSVRVHRAKKQYRVSDVEAERILDTADKRHKKFVSIVYGQDLSDPSLYHLILNTSSLTVDECVSAVNALITEKEALRQLEMQTEYAEIIDNHSERPVLKNQSEIEFAKILDIYQIDWIYEPKTFPIEWDAEGNIRMAFSPDFYLTKFDTYIELTTMDQKYVTQKNKKIKKLRELYPGVNIKIVYKKDFISLIERFNLNRGELS